MGLKIGEFNSHRISTSWPIRCKNEGNSNHYPAGGFQNKFLQPWAVPNRV